MERQLNMTFADRRLIRQAFTHSSYVNEQKKKRIKDNERLEFLGDAVLELAISEYLFRQFPNKSEGVLTKMRASIVCEESLVTFAEALNFGKYILLGKGEALSGGRERPALLADVFEAFVGALYLDQGLPAVQYFLQSYIYPLIDRERMFEVTDYKSELQETIQQDGRGELRYVLVEERGPAHNREFVIDVQLENTPIGHGTGRSKKEAEQRAASDALKKLKKAR